MPSLKALGQTKEKLLSKLSFYQSRSKVKVKVVWVKNVDLSQKGLLRGSFVPNMRAVPLVVKKLYST